MNVQDARTQFSTLLGQAHTGRLAGRLGDEFFESLAADEGNAWEKH
ncbi:MAG: hypothetical protein ACKPE6_17570 [Gammaproteobacteria bacterium]